MRFEKATAASFRDTGAALRGTRTGPLVAPAALKRVWEAGSHLAKGRWKYRGVEDGLLASLKNHMQTSSPDFVGMGKEKLDVMKKPPSLRSSTRPCMERKREADILNLRTLLVNGAVLLTRCFYLPGAYFLFCP